MGDGSWEIAPVNRHLRLAEIFGYPQGAPLQANRVGVPLVGTRGFWPKQNTYCDTKRKYTNNKLQEDPFVIIQISDRSPQSSLSKLEAAAS
jgi:hypothetical protein